MKLCLQFLSLLLIANFATSQSTLRIDTIELNTMRIPLKAQETGKQITVMDKAEIQALGSNSIDELLQTVSGVELQSRGAFGVQGDILMRGSTFTQVLVLIDGMKMNDPLTGHFNSYIPVTIGQIERIEVLRGASSALYGADAVGGVINIITKGFESSSDGQKTNGALYYGSNQLVDAESGFTSTNGAWNLSGGVSIKQSPGEEVAADTSNMLEAYQTYFDIKTVNASVGYQFNNRYRLTAFSAFDHRDFDARYFYTTSPFDKSTERVGNWWNRLQLKRIGNKSVTDINVAYKYNTDEFVFSPDFQSTNIHESRFINFMGHHQRNLNDQIVIDGGLQIDRRSISSNDRGDHDDMHYGVFLMGVYRQHKLNVVANLRADQDENYGLQISPNLNISYVLPNLVFRASFGRSIRAADYTERYVSNNLTDLTPGRSLGNPSLSSETSWSQELGIDFSPSKTWSLNSTIFLRQSDQLIDFVSTNQTEIGSVSELGSLQSGADYFFARNVSDVVTQGVEIASVFSFDLGNASNLNWHLGYTYLNTTNEEDLISVYISSHAKHLASTKIIFKSSLVDFAISGLFKQRDARIAESIGLELEENYMLWNVHLSKALTQHFSLAFQMNNVFDKSYQNILGARMPNRWLRAGVTWNIQ